MQKIFFFCLFFLFSLSMQAQNADSTRVLDSLKAVFDTYKREVENIQAEHQKKIETIPPSTAKWAEDNVDLGEVREGKTISHRFIFTNTGKNDLVIVNVKPSCGCTSPEWSQEAIKPGKTGFIDITFNATGREGTQKKKVLVSGNFENETEKVLHFTVEVIPNTF